MDICKVQNCGQKIKHKDYCTRHYMQIYRHGRIIKTKFEKNEIVDCGEYYKMFLYNNKQEVVDFTLFDKQDLDLVKIHKWRKDFYGYATDEKIRMNRLILNAPAWCPPDYLVVDHINKNRLDNRRNNLRIITLKENSKVQDKKRKVVIV